MTDNAPKREDANADLATNLGAFIQRSLGARNVAIDGLRLLTGGASRQTWSFDATIEHADGRTETRPLVMRSDARRGPSTMTRDVEYRVLQAATAAGVPAPEMYLMGDDSLGSAFFLMERIEGETIARRLLRDDEYAEARSTMTAQLGEAVAGIHKIPVDSPGLDTLMRPDPGKSPAETELDRFDTTYRSITPDPHPAFELAFRWLRRNPPQPPERLTFVHGDFRVGNFIFGPEGLRSVLDWELAHIGDPAEDLSWVCMRSWRFGSDDLPVGGIGRREELWEAYEASAGRPVDRAAAHWWEVFGNLKWGIMCISQAQVSIATGGKAGAAGPMLELLAIGRRSAETEFELLNLMKAEA